MTSECKQQFTLRISQANPTEMVVILYEMTLCYLDESKVALAAGETVVFREAVRKTRGCINELMRSLHLEYEPAPALLQLYLYCLRKLVSGELKKSEEDFNDIEKVIRPLKDAYGEIASQNKAGAVMNNSQAVYAGLTYGRNSLTENMADQGSNRGMLA